MKRFGKGDHKMRSGQRKIPQSLCDNPRCKFYGKPAQQGVCYSTLDPAQSRYIKYVLDHGEGLLKEIKQLRTANGCKTDKKWIRHLEGMVVTTWANNWFGLDELIYLRAECAKLRLQVEKAQLGQGRR
jgi:hypothetical protein